MFWLRVHYCFLFDTDVLTPFFWLPVRQCNVSNASVATVKLFIPAWHAHTVVSVFLVSMSQWSVINMTRILKQSDMKAKRVNRVTSFECKYTHNIAQQKMQQFCFCLRVGWVLTSVWPDLVSVHRPWLVIRLQMHEMIHSAVHATQQLLWPVHSDGKLFFYTAFV